MVLVSKDVATVKKTGALKKGYREVVTSNGRKMYYTVNKPAKKEEKKDAKKDAKIKQKKIIPKGKKGKEEIIDSESDSLDSEDLISMLPKEQQDELNALRGVGDSV